MPQEYNLSVHLSWGHFLTVRGKAAPTLFAATSTATFKALRATKCIVLHSQGLNYSEVRPSSPAQLLQLHLRPPGTSQTTLGTSQVAPESRLYPCILSSVIVDARLISGSEVPTTVVCHLYWQ